MQRVSIDRANTVLYCDRWAATVEFYRDLLAFEIAHETDWFVEFHLVGAAFLSIADAGRATIEAVGGQGVTLTFHTDALAETRALLDGSGVATTPIARRWGAHVFYCHDPEGHRIEFWCDSASAAE